MTREATPTVPVRTPISMKYSEAAESFDLPTTLQAPIFPTGAIIDTPSLWRELKRTFRSLCKEGKRGIDPPPFSFSFIRTREPELHSTSRRARCDPLIVMEETWRGSLGLFPENLNITQTVKSHWSITIGTESTFYSLRRIVILSLAVLFLNSSTILRDHFRLRRASTTVFIPIW